MRTVAPHILKLEKVVKLEMEEKMVKKNRKYIKDKMDKDCSIKK